MDEKTTMKLDVKLIDFWFKIGVLFLLAVIAVCVVIYVHDYHSIMIQAQESVKQLQQQVNTELYRTNQQLYKW